MVLTKSEFNFDWFEIRRKIFHIIVGILIVAAVYYDILTFGLVLFLLLLSLVLSYIYRTVDIPLIDYFLKRFERTEHIKKFPAKGVIFLLIGLLVLVSFFNKNIIMASVFIWAFGDSFSAVIGKSYGSRKLPLNSLKSIEGLIAGIIAATLASSLFVNWVYALVSSCIAIFVESLDIRFFDYIVDDNFLVPVAAGIILSLLL